MALTFSQGYMRGNGDPNLDVQIQDGGAKIPKLYIDDFTDNIYGFDNNFASGSKWKLILAGVGDVETNIKVLLQGNASGTGMSTTLAASSLIPLVEPYTKLGYYRSQGGETVADLTVFTTNSISDWVLVELRDKNNPTLVKYDKAALLKSDGVVVDVDGISNLVFENIELDKYYLSIKHRNHFGIMTSTAVNISQSIDFSDTATLIWGDSVYFLVDGNGDRRLRRGKMDSSGINRREGFFGFLAKIKKASAPSQTGVYSIYDVTLDGLINAFDLGIATASNSFHPSYSTNNIFFTTFEQIPNQVEPYLKSLINYNSFNSVIIASGTTAEREAAPNTGYIRYNTTDNKLEYYNGTVWVQL